MYGWRMGHSGPGSSDSRKEHIDGEVPGAHAVVHAATAALARSRPLQGTLRRKTSTSTSLKEFPTSPRPMDGTGAPALGPLRCRERPRCAQPPQQRASASEPMRSRARMLVHLLVRARVGRGVASVAAFAVVASAGLLRALVSRARCSGPLPEK